MSQLTTKNVVRQKRDVSSVMETISPEKTPILSAIGTKKILNNNLYEFYQDENPNGTTDNAQYEGADINNYDGGYQPSIIGNRCQTFLETLQVSGSMAANKNVEVRNDISRQLKHKGTNLRKSIEKCLTSNIASQAEDKAANKPQRFGGLQTFIKTNVSRGVGGANGGYNGSDTVVATDGEKRDVTEPMVIQVLESLYNTGADTDGLTLFSGTYTKSTLDAVLNGNNSRTVDMRKNKTIASSVDYYESSFGQVNMQLNINQPKRCAFIINPDLVTKGVYRPEVLEKMAKTGDSTKYALLTELTIEVHEKGLGLIADLKSSATDSGV